MLTLAALGAAAARASPAAPGLEQLVGQRLVVAMAGTAPGPALLRRVETGAVGGVILFGGNVRDATQVRTLTDALRAAALRGGQPRPLVLADQEGGLVRRLRWAPPVAPAAELGRLRTAELVRTGVATGRALRAVGIDVDLAPVADVPTRPDAFLTAQRRAFSTRPGAAARSAAAFARGLAQAGVAATAKHFPGLGRATASTDVERVTIDATRDQLLAGLEPFRLLVEQGVPLVMLSNAVYPALGPQPAAWSPGVRTLLRDELGFRGVTITDALEAASIVRRTRLGDAAVAAARAGTDLVLLAGSERASARVHDELLAAARSGRLTRASLQRSYARILALKRRLRAPA